MIKKEQQTYIDQAKSSPIFKGVDSQDLENLFKFSHLKNYQKGEFLFMKEDDADGFYILLKGMLKKFTIEEEGNEAVLDIIIDSGIIFEISNQIFPYSCSALEDSVVIYFSAAEFKKLMQKNNIF